MVFIACKMLEPEINSILKELNSEISVCWIERGLHNDPAHLHTVLQEHLDSMANEDSILLGLSACGGAAFNLECKSERMVVPRFDDCIRTVLSSKANSDNNADPYTLYYTRGWLECEHSLPNEHLVSIEKYGIKRAERMLSTLIGNYRSFCAVDTGLGDFNEWQEYAKKSAEIINLPFRSCKGSMNVYLKLLTGDWDDNFIIKKRGEKIQYQDFHPVY